jgi:hypothetical protein
MVFPAAQSHAPKGREKLPFRFFGRGVEKSNAYKAPGAAIEGVPATLLFPEIDLMSALSVMAHRHAAAGNGSAMAPKYTASGVA